MTFLKEQRVQVLKGVDTGKPGTVKQGPSYQVLVDGRTVLKPYAEASLMPLKPPSTPVPAPVPTPSAATWDGSADKGLPGPWGQVQQWGAQVTVVDSPVLPNRKAFRFTSSDQPFDNGPRAELADTFRLVEDAEWWFGDVFYAKSGQPAWAPGHHTVIQFKNEGTGSPPLNFDIRDWGGGKAGLYAQEEPWNASQNYRLILPITKLYDRAVPIEIRCKFSSDPNVGNYEVWADGVQVIPPVKMATLLRGLTSGLKQGDYGLQPNTITYWHGMKRGTSRASVLR